MFSFPFVPKKVPVPAAVAIGFGITASLLFGFIYSIVSTTVASRGVWDEIKTSAGLTLADSHFFMHTPQPIITGALNLSAWHGFQEIRTKKPYRFSDLSFRFKLERGAHLSLLTGLGDNTYGFIRLSSRSEFPSAHGIVDASGKFVSFVPTELLISDTHWHTFDLRRGDSADTINIDGKPYWRISRPGISLPATVGFRGSLAPCYLDDVILKQGSTTLLSDRFSRFQMFITGTVYAVFFFLFSVFTIFLISRASGRRARIIHYFLFLSVSATACLFPAATAVRYIFSRYPDYRAVDRMNSGSIFPYIDFGTKKQSANTDFLSPQLHHPVPYSKPEEKGGRTLVMFSGGSQTFGTGASSLERSWAVMTGRMLASDYPDRSPVVFNIAFEGATAPELASDYEQYWLDFQPDVFVLNTSSNDIFWKTTPEDFEQAIESVLLLNKYRHIQTILIPEPHAAEHADYGQTIRHDILRKLGVKYHVPVLEVQRFLRERENTGFLWWDFVHLTNYGQRLFAEYLRTAIPEALGWSE